MTALTNANSPTLQARVPAGVIAMQGGASLPCRAGEVCGGTRQSFGRGEQLFGEGDRSECFYKVLSGTVRTCKILSDGRRQIEAFHLPGEFFGLESGPEHGFTAEAVDYVVVLSFRRSRFTSLLHDDREFGDELMASVMASLQRAHKHMVLLGRKTAQEKLATFLLDMADRLGGTSGKADRFDLPMQRTDIADHLGLTIETVSRTLTQMARSGLIKLAAASRNVVIADRLALQSLDD
jgi:CRP/FNR family nitrogen fixation transcriptional regulator